MFSFSTFLNFIIFHNVILLLLYSTHFFQYLFIVILFFLPFSVPELLLIVNVLTVQSDLINTLLIRKQDKVVLFKSKSVNVGA